MKNPRVRLVLPIGGKATAIREALIKSDRGNVSGGDVLGVRLEKGKRKALKDLAANGGVTAADLTRLLIDAALKLGVPGVEGFLEQAAKSK